MKDACVGPISKGSLISIQREFYFFLYAFFLFCCLSFSLLTMKMAGKCALVTDGDEVLQFYSNVVKYRNS